MSEQINSTLPFPGMEESEALDFGATFGGGSGTGDTNPFDPPAAQAVEPAAIPEPAPEVLAQPEVQPVSVAAEQPKTQKQPNHRQTKHNHQTEQNAKAHGLSMFQQAMGITSIFYSTKVQFTK